MIDETKGERMKVRLAEILKERGLTQMDFVKMSGLSEGTISRWYGSRVDLSTIEKMCNALDIEPGDLLVRNGKEAK